MTSSNTTKKGGALDIADPGSTAIARQTTRSFNQFKPKKNEIQTPTEPDPTPTPIPGREEDQAKKKARRRGGGRASTVFAGNLQNSRNNSILRTRLG